MTQQIYDREEPLRQLVGAMGSLSSGRGHAVLISGEAGSGKTTLVSAFEKSRPDNTRVLRGACENLSIAEPLGPLWDIARHTGWQLPPELLSGDSRLALFSHALEIFAEDGAMTVVVIEDIHWADDATLDFLRFVIRRLADHPFLLIMTTRQEDLATAARIRGMFDGAQTGSITRVILSPLSDATVRMMAVEHGKDPDFILEVSGGNPFFVTELLEMEDGGVPLSVQDAILSRVDRALPQAREIINWVSIFPGRAEKELVGLLCGEEFAGGSDAALGSGLLQEAGAYLAFRHELARRAVETSVAPGRLAQMHAEMLALLRQKGNAAKARLLHHAHAAGDEAEIGRIAPLAADEASKLGALREAAGYFQLAVEYTTGMDDEAFADLLEKSADANSLLGKIDLAFQLQERALALFVKSGQVEGEGNSYRRMSRFTWLRGEIDQARQYAGKASQILHNHRGRGLAMAHSTTAQLAMLDHDFDLATNRASLAIEIAEELELPDVTSHALNNRGMSLVWSDPQSGRADLHRSLAIALRDDELDHASRAMTNIVHFEYERLDFAAAADMAQRGIEYSERNDIFGYLAYNTGSFSWVRLRTGHWDEARRLADESLRLATNKVVMESSSFPGWCTIAWLSARQSRDDDAGVLHTLAEYPAIAQEMQRQEVYAALIGERAWLGLEDREHAVALLEKVLSTTRSPEHGAEAMLWLHRLGGDVTGSVTSGLLAPYRLELSGDWRGAALAWAEVGAPYEHALSLSYGDGPARNQALEILLGLGADRVVQRLRARMRDDGIRITAKSPRASTRRNPFGLTRRQMEVLTLLDQDLSNFEISERLFVSPKTVDHHVSAILARLEVTSRREAAAKARETNLFRDQ